MGRIEKTMLPIEIPKERHHYVWGQIKGLPPGMQRFVWEIMKKSWVWNDFLKNMCSKDILNFTQKLDSFGEPLFFYPVANTFSQTNCQIPRDTCYVCR